MNPLRVSLAGRRLLAIGLMSGTSHDGVSAALVRLDERACPPAKLLAFKTFPYASRFRRRLLGAASGAGVGAGELSALNFELGRRFARAALGVARLARVPTSRIAFIGSHGHTVFHLPPRRALRGETASTMQIGEPAVIAAMTGVATVADFRPMDIALGGEGAPLAPLAHLWLCADRRLGRVIQNIGGIANATYMRPGAKRGGAGLLAFDTGPGVMLIDALAARLSHGRMKMDRGGRMAARGRVCEALLGRLMRHPYFRRRPPKSTGREEFGAHCIAEIERRARVMGVAGDNLVATVTALTARSIADAIRRFVMPRGRVAQVILTGGGARNPALVRMIREALPETTTLIAEQAGIHGEALEAVAFAILAYEMLRGRPGNVPAATGARAPAILGKLTLPPAPARRSPA